MFADRMHTKRCEINWSRAFTEDGIRRLSLVKKLSRLFSEQAAFSETKPQYIENSANDDVITYIRSCGEESIFVAVNLRSKEIVAGLSREYKGTELLSDGVEICEKEIRLSPFGYTVIKI